MNHAMKIRNDETQPARPFFASCSCGPQGNFAKKEDAIAYLKFHEERIYGGMNTSEFLDETLPKEEPPKAEEKKGAKKKGA